MRENDGSDADFEGEVVPAEPALPPPTQSVEPKPEDLVAPAELVRQALQDLPRFRLEQQQLVDQVLKQPAGKMRSSSLRANLKLLEQAPAEPRRWVVAMIEQALKQAQELRAWLLEKQRPAG